jgi:hypothetical protein
LLAHAADAFGDVGELLLDVTLIFLERRELVSSTAATSTPEVPLEVRGVPAVVVVSVPHCGDPSS